MQEKDYPEFLGVLPDPRTDEEKEKDYKSEEIIASAPVLDWKPLDISKIQIFFPHNQAASSSCVAQTIATMKSRNQYREEGKAIDASATYVYQKRVNRPTLGMIGDDALQISLKKGTTLEVLMPSQNLSDGEMDGAVSTKLDDQIAQVLRSSGYFTIPLDIERIAQIIESDRKRGIGVPVMTWFQWPINGEWWMPVPKEGNGWGEIGRHSVCAVEYGMYEGEKALAIQDSAGVSSTLEPGKKNIRIVKESYLKKHIFYAAYETDLKNDWRDQVPPASNKPIHTFNHPLEYTPAFSVSDEVKILQDILKYEGIFSTSVESTGWYGPYTAKCVLEYQKKHGIPDDGIQGRRIGPKTLSDLNMRYGN